ncbi:hypothetical protein SDC9_105805 [bioreactor metagenome]|uniref:Uncharacterized protein n=1 Tax=bioreactor metagenome TaxID=1076179 RepID=A0A645B0K8_9ZZZZ
MDRRQFISGVGYAVLSLGIAWGGLNLSERSSDSKSPQSAPISQPASSV